MMELTLREGGRPVSCWLDDAVGDALAQSKIVTAIRLGGGEWEVAPTTKVGVASVAGVTVRIEPKVAIDRILFLLGFAHDPGWRHDTVAMSEVDDLLPALAQAFADQAERAIELGLLQGYREVDESLTVLRGRLRGQDQLRQRFGIAIPLLVTYDEHSVDISENQLLRAATELLLRVPGVPVATRARLRRLRQSFGEVSSLVRGAALPTWTPSRPNSRYHIALRLSELILRHNALDQRSGGVRVSGFVVDMAKVFEDFLTAALTQSLQRFGGWTRAQDRHHLDVDATVVMKPDLVWYLDGTPAVVVDAKYKAEKPAGFPDADLYQMLAYCTALGLAEGHLVYARGNALETKYTVRHVGVSIHAHTLDLQLAPGALLRQVDALADRLGAERAPVLVT